jgi:hypothetical protein
MKSFEIFAIVIIILLLLSLVLGFYYSDSIIKNNPFMDRNLLSRGMNRPTIWLYYDHSDVNSRSWLDFGSRSNRALNTPFLNLCYETIVTQNPEYRVEVIHGLAGIAELLGGQHMMPSRLQNLIASVNDAEMTWIRAAILAKYGGLWLTPYSICLRPFNELPKDKVRFYGTDIQETLSGSSGTSVPGFNCIWSPAPKHPMFVDWEQIARSRLNDSRGGQQIRRDANWDWVNLSSKYPGIEIDVHGELARKKGGKRIELEDLLSTGHEGNLPFDVPNYSIYVPIFWPELRDREFFGWFLRMSESQIMDSDTSVKYLIKMGLTPPIQPLQDSQHLSS